MTDNEFKYWAFLGFSPQDNCEHRPEAQNVNHLCWGDWLQDALKNFSVPAEFAGQINGRGEIIPERIDATFQTEPELAENASLSPAVRQVLDQSRYLIVICSPRSAQSLSVNEAVRYFKQLGRGSHVVPIVIAGEPYASEANKPGRSPADECFVPALRHPVQPDGTLDTTKRVGGYLFADARYGIEKREILSIDQRHTETDLEIAKLQLIAGLIGVGFNGLWWREQKRRFVGFAEAQHQAREALSQVQAAQLQIREAQNKVLEIQNLPSDVHGQIQEAQNQALAAQNQARETQKQLQEFQNKARDTQSLLEEARNRALAAESKVLEAQNQARDARHQAEETQRQLQEASSPVQAVLVDISEAQRQAEEARRQIQEIQNQAQSSHAEALAAQGKVLEAQNQLEAARNRAHEAQKQVQEIKNQTQDVQSQIQAAQDQVLSAQKQAGEAQSQILAIRNKALMARRLTKVFALLAVLALLAASIALRQRKVANQALAKVTADSAWSPDSTLGRMDQAQIRQALQNINGVAQDENRRRSLNELAVWIPRDEIPEALKSSSLILNDQQRSHFQKWLLVRLGWMNPLSAMTCASGIAGKIVNEDETSDSSNYFQLVLLDNWMQTDLSGAFSWACQLPDTDARQRALEKIIPALAVANPQNTFIQLNDLKPAPSEQIFTLLFQRWATHDPVQAIQQWQQIPDHDQDGNILSAIITAWMAQQPDAALDWVKSQPDSESKNKALETCIGELTKTDAPQALALAESLPEGNWRSVVMAGVFNGWAARDLEAATTACLQLPEGIAKENAWDCVLNQRMAKNPAADPEAAVNWLGSFLKTNSQPEQMQSAIKAWAKAEPAAVAQWLATVPAETNSEGMVSAFLEGAVAKYPEYAGQWTQSVTNETDRQKYQIQVARQWLKTDPSAALKWINSLDLPEEIKKKLIAPSP